MAFITHALLITCSSVSDSSKSLEVVTDSGESLNIVFHEDSSSIESLKDSDVVICFEDRLEELKPNLVVKSIGGTAVSKLSFEKFAGARAYLFTEDKYKLKYVLDYMLLKVSLIKYLGEDAIDIVLQWYFNQLEELVTV